MSPELEAAATKLLEKVNATGDFVVSQSPEIVQQFLYMERFYCISCFSLSAISILLIWQGSFRCWKKYLDIKEEDGRAYNRNEEVPYFIGAIISGGVLAMTSLVALCEGFSRLSAFIAPKVAYCR